VRKNKKLVTGKRIIFGEGCFSAPFYGSIWTKDDLETEEQAEDRYGKTMTELGLKVLFERPK